MARFYSSSLAVGLSLKYLLHLLLEKHFTKNDITLLTVIVPLNKFSAVRREEVCSLLRQLSKASCSGTKKVDLHYFFSLLSYNVALRMSAGKKYIEEEVACSDQGKQDLKEIKKIFNPPLSIGLCDFFPALKWIDYKGFQKSVIKLRNGRDGFLQDLVDEIRQKKTSSCSIPDAGLEKTTVIEVLLSLQEQEPDLYTDDIIKGLAAVSSFCRKI
ncbi:hypothetical protein SADUNF_Sadunf14G0011300 [Salix dunnii]|uniref:Uncharacterized protein n=1 Tax=Salix dunnii TaxID=1413687 RepID=A0A835MJ77_9ROSI|nr:hypothetical protein SADUNF_Sadunf14G0011300 [Salix dunnii]